MRITAGNPLGNYPPRQVREVFKSGASHLYSKTIATAKAMRLVIVLQTHAPVSLKSMPFFCCTLLQMYFLRYVLFAQS